MSDDTVKPDVPDDVPRVKDAAAVELGRRGGLVSGARRMTSLTPAQRRRAAMAGGIATRELWRKRRAAKLAK